MKAVTARRPQPAAVPCTRVVHEQWLPPPLPRGVAVLVDLGSDRTRLVLRNGTVTDEPTVLAVHASGCIRGAGTAALRLAAREHGVRLVRPVRGGRVVDALSAVHLLQQLLAASGVGPVRVVGVIATEDATLGDVAVLRGVVGAAAGAARVVVVPTGRSGPSRDGDTPPAPTLIGTPEVSR